MSDRPFPISGGQERHSAMNTGWGRALGWLLALLLPLSCYLYFSAAGAGRHISIFVAIAAGTLVLWVFSLLAEFIPALLALLAILLFGLAPESVVLSGFSSSGFLLAFSIMGLGVAISESGLTYRYTLFLLHKLPSNTAAHQLAVFFTGFLFTPIVPAIAGRAAIVGPVVNHIYRGWDPETRKRAATQLYTTGLDSIHYLAPWFLTAAPANLMIFALLPAQEQQAYGFLFWAYAASVTGLLLLVFYWMAASLYFGGFASVQISRTEVEAERRRLGPMSQAERVALSGVLLLGLGIASAGLHRIEIPYLSFAVLCLVLYLGVLTRKDFIGKIDWAFLALLASMIGILASMSYLEIDQAIMVRLRGLGTFMREEFELFVLVLVGVLLLARLVIPLNQAILIFAAALIPIADQAGVAPWVVGFVILVVAETAFFAYQSPYIYLFRELTSEVPREERRVRGFHALLVPLKLVAILASIPFWRHIGVL